MANIRNELDYINAMAREDPAGLVAASEQRYCNIIAGIAGKSLETRGHKLVLLAGPSSSGKTTTAQKLADALRAGGQHAHRISLDDFYLEADTIPRLPDGTADIESVYALDLPLLGETLRALMETGRGDIPHFKFSDGRRSRFDTLEIDRDDMIILEGLHALHPEISEHCGFPANLRTGVYISVSSRIYDDRRNIVLHKRGLRLVRRILRDSQFRGTGAEETIAMWPAVTRGEDAWLTPCKPFANVNINSIHIYEPCVFAGRVLPLLEAIPAGSPSAKEGARLAKSLRRFAVLPEEYVPEDSLLREFLGD